MSFPDPSAVSPRKTRKAAKRGLRASLRHFIVTVKRQTRRFLGRTSAGERWLVLALVIYSMTAALFFWLTWHGHEYAVVRYVVTVVSLALALYIQEATSKRRLLLRIGLMCIPAVVIGLQQGEIEVTIVRLSDELVASTLQRWRELEVRAQESRVREEIVLEPIGAIEEGEVADQGFMVKASRLQVQVFEREAHMLVDHPELAQVILRIPEDPQARLSAYERLSAGQPSLAVAADAVLQPLREQVAYLDVANVFQREIKPQYQSLRSGINRKELLTNDVCNRVFKIIDGLRQVAASHRVAGLYNHIGNMALNCGRPEEALGFFYDALAIDDTHLTVYETLSYALWIVNKDSESALRYADRGLRLCLSERSAQEASFSRTIQMYESFEHNSPSYAPLVSYKIKTVREFRDAIQNRMVRVVDNLTNRFKNSYSYFSALELKNETEARAYMADLYNSKPSNANYQDTMGFVFMRFAKDEVELNRAEQLFTSAIENPSALPDTKQLVSGHLQEVSSYKSQLHRRSESAR